MVEVDMEDLRVLALLEDNLKTVIDPEIFYNWITATVTSGLENYSGYWDITKAEIAEELSCRLENFLLSFISDQTWWARNRLKETATRIISVIDLFNPIISFYVRPPISIFRRLEGFHRNIFRIQPYVAQEASMKTLIERIVDVCEIYFLNERPGGHKLVPNCVIHMLTKPKLTIAAVKRLNSWSSYFLLFRMPHVVDKEADISLHNLFPDLDQEDWEKERDAERTPELIVPTGPLLEVEKVDYLADAILQLFCRPDALFASAKPDAEASTEGRKLLATLFTVNKDFINLGRIAIDNVMCDEKLVKQLDELANIIIKAWISLHKASERLRFDLEALVISDLMQRSLKTSPKAKHKLWSKYCLMVSHMYNCTDAAARRMFHSNYDLMVLDAVKSDNHIPHANALHMMGRCFPLIGPEVPKAQWVALVALQMDTLITNLKSPYAEYRAAAAQAVAEALHRGWTFISVSDRGEALRQIAERLAYDSSSVVVRSAAVKAAFKLLDQTLARPNMVDALALMKEVATDENISVRAEYYLLILKAVKLGLHALEKGDKIINSEQMVLHFIEQDRPYGGTIEEILDQMIWNIDNLKFFLVNSIRLFIDQTAVAVKCFHTIPKTKSPADIHTVLNCIFSQVYLALSYHIKGEPDPKGAPVSMSKPDGINAALELGGTIWAATVLILSQDVDKNTEIQAKAIKLLLRAMPFTDVLKETNLYRIACRVPIDQIPDYYNWCMDQLQSTSDVKEGITLMTFVNTWGKGAELIALARKWISADLKATKRGRDESSEEKRAHLGLLYLSMLMSDPDISGSFNEMENEVTHLAKESVDAFLKCLPVRFSRNPRTEQPVDDKFYYNVLIFLSLIWIHRTRYAKDGGALRDSFHQILIKVKTFVCDWVGLGTPNNILNTVQSYKSQVKAILKTRGGFAAEQTTILLADNIMKTLQDILQQIEEISCQTDDPELQQQLRGFAVEPGHVTLVTPTNEIPLAPSKPSRPKRKNT